MVRIITKKRMNHFTQSKLGKGVGRSRARIEPEPVADLIETRDLANVLNPSGMYNTIRIVPSQEIEPVELNIENARPVDERQLRLESDYSNYSIEIENLLDILDENINTIDDFKNYTDDRIYANINRIKKFLKPIIRRIKECGFGFNTSENEIGNIDNIDPYIIDENYIDNYNTYMRNKSREQGFQHYKALMVNVNLISKIKKVMDFVKRFNNIIMKGNYLTGQSNELFKY